MNGTFLIMLQTDRWEATNGMMCRKSRAETVTPEAVRDHWDIITDFTHSCNPESNQDAMAEVVKVNFDNAVLIQLILVY